MNEGSESLRAVRVRTRTTAADAHTLLAGALVGVREFAGGRRLMARPRGRGGGAIPALRSRLIGKRDPQRPTDAYSAAARVAFSSMAELATVTLLINGEECSLELDTRTS